MELAYSIAATFFISLLSLVGVVFLGWSTKRLNNLIFVLVAFAAGSLMGGAFLHLMPRAIKEGLTPQQVSVWVLIGFSSFFLLERIIRWRHCHEQPECDVHPVGWLNIIGDGVHNFFDGVVIAGGFLVSPELGITMTLLMAAHELPQEIGDFGVLVHAGFTIKQALFWNFVSAITAVLGAVVGFYVFAQVKETLPYLMAFAAGNFLYISSSDLVPDLHKEPKLSRSVISFSIFILAIFFMELVKHLHHVH